MNNRPENPIGVCTWSLQNDFHSVARILETNGISHLHLAVDAFTGKHAEAFRKAIAQEGWTVSSTMIGFPQEDYSTIQSIRRTGGIMPDDCWKINRNLFLEAIILTADLGVPFLSTHVGFIDHPDKEAYLKFCQRMRELADAAQSRNIGLLMETGQESAEDLRLFLEDFNHPAVGVNFDPANMILYDKGDPIEAIRILARWIRHVHIKDAIKTTVPGKWGHEVPWGEGQVPIYRFLEELQGIGYSGVLAIEREAGVSREGDIIQTVERLRANPA